MSNPHNVGIDVSMKRLDVAILPAGARFSVANDDAGWAELVDRLRQFAIAAVGLEPTGGYERGIVRALLAAGLSVRRINPAPFLFYLDFGSFSVVGSSPEVLVRLRDGTVTIRPLAGKKARSMAYR